MLFFLVLRTNGFQDESSSPVPLDPPIVETAVRLDLAKNQKPGEVVSPGSCALLTGRPYRPSLLTELNNAKRAVTVVIIAGGEKQLIRVSVRASRTALPELNGPYVVNFNRLPALVPQRAKERPALRIKRVNPSVRRIVRNQQRVAHRAKIAGRQCHAPRRM